MLYGVLGICGLLAAIRKSHVLAKTFSWMWWGVTVVSALVSVVSLFVVFSAKEEEPRLKCQDEFSSFSDIDVCYSDGEMRKMAAAFLVGANVVLMCFCGLVATWYGNEVRQLQLHETSAAAQVPELKA